MDYDSEGLLATATTTGASPSTVTYAYDTDGSQLIRRDDASTTLYLGSAELRLTRSTGVVTAARYYEFGGQTYTKKYAAAERRLARGAPRSPSSVACGFGLDISSDDAREIGIGVGIAVGVALCVLLEPCPEIAVEVGAGGALGGGAVAVGGSTVIPIGVTVASGAGVVTGGVVGGGIGTGIAEARGEPSGEADVPPEAEDGTLDAPDLSAGQASNYARYTKKLPAGAKDPVISRGASGSVQFSADAPGRVPGSYARYTKVVESGGKTTNYSKTTVAPDGSIVHVKVKYP